MSKLPLGALTKDECKKTISLKKFHMKKETRFYGVSTHEGLVQSGTHDNFLFDFPNYFYFTNYWHAYAFSLKLKVKDRGVW